MRGHGRACLSPLCISKRHSLCWQPAVSQITQVTSKKTIACTSEPLSQLNTRCMETIGQILVGTEQELRALVEKIQKQVRQSPSYWQKVAARSARPKSHH